MLLKTYRNIALLIVISIFTLLDSPTQAREPYKVGLFCSNYVMPKKIENADALIKQIKLKLKETDEQGYKAIEFVSDFVKKHCNQTADLYLRYIDKDFYGNLDNNLFIIVHETYHAYTSIYGNLLVGEVIKSPQGLEPDPGGEVWLKSKFRGQAFYFLDSDHHVVEITKTFPSKELMAVIPKEFRTTRFKPYIDGHPSGGTQRDGVYGLLDEFHAYYHDYITSTRFFNALAWETFTSEHLSFYEFKYFILKYLIYAQKKQPKIFRRVMKNEEFKKVFSIIHDRFEKRVNHNLEKAKVAFLKKYEEYDSYSWNFVRYEKKDYYKAFENQSGIKEVYLLKKELEKPEYEKMIKLLKL